MSVTDTSINKPGLVWCVLLDVSAGYVEVMRTESEASCVLGEYLALVDWMNEWVSEWMSEGVSESDDPQAEIWREVEMEKEVKGIWGWGKACAKTGGCDVLNIA